MSVDRSLSRGLADRVIDMYDSLTNDYTIAAVAQCTVAPRNRSDVERLAANLMQVAMSLESCS